MMETYQRTGRTHWDVVAKKQNHGRGMGSLLAQLQPSQGFGIDFSGEMIARARQEYPDFEYHQTNAYDLSGLKDEFDIIILSDLVNDLWDVQRTFEQPRKFRTPHT